MNTISSISASKKFSAIKAGTPVTGLIFIPNLTISFNTLTPCSSSKVLKTSSISSLTFLDCSFSFTKVFFTTISLAF
uniref:Uncharacterized protein n=1 Tax=uncultured marine virus TaxID=186617 RepID=A0A0F7LB92_9VIRU|nr:hypothetical protein [uncultured marine virus]